MDNFSKNFPPLTRVKVEFRDAADNSPALIWMAGTDGLCNWFNRGWLEFTGRAMEQEVGNGWAEGVHHEDLQPCIDHYLRHFNAREHFLLEYRLRRHDGQFRWILDSGTPVFDTKGAFLGYNGVCFDITERREAEDEMRISAIAFNTQEGIFVTDANRIILRTNPAFTKITGYLAADVIGQSPRLFTSELQNSEFYSSMWRCISRSGYWQGEMWNQRKNGELFLGIITISAIKNTEGKVTHYLCNFIDITARKKLEEELTEKTRSLLESQAIAKIGSWSRGINSKTVHWTDEVYKLYGLSPSTNTPTWDEYLELLHPDDRHTMNQWSRACMAGEQPFPLYFRTHPRNGEKWLLGTGILEKDASGKALRLIGTVQDVTTQKQVENSLRISATAFETQEGILITDSNNLIIRTNTAFTEITHYKAVEVVGKNPNILSSGTQNRTFYQEMWSCIHNAGKWEGEIYNRRKSGEIFPARVTITVVYDPSGNVTNYVANLSDITESKRAAEALENLAFFDPLTKLPNRRLFFNRLEQAVLACARSEKKGALLYLDLDNFKPLNDAHGHKAGDLLLVEVARRLKSCIREIDTVSRFGGDEFVIILSDLLVDQYEATKQAHMVAEKILSSISSVYRLNISATQSSENIIEHYCTASIGVAIFDSKSNDLDAIIKQADVAMYQAKLAEKNTVRFHATLN